MPKAAEKAKWTNYAKFTETRCEKLFDERVVRCFVDRPRSLYSLLAHGLAANPEGEALIAEKQRLKYKELDSLVSQAAGGLRDLGIAKGDRVALLLSNAPEYIVLIFAIAKLGAIAVPLNIREEAPELAFILNDCEAKILIHEGKLEGRIPDPNALQSVKHYVSVALEDKESLSQLTAGDTVEACVEVGEEDVAAILYTSGTTGRPKGAMICNVNIAHSVMHYREAMQISAEDRSVIAVPMSHITGLIALIGLCAYAGAALVIMDQFKAERFIELAERERITHTLLVPTMFALCLMHPDLAQRDLRTWRVAGYGGAIMPEATLREIGKKLPNLDLVNAYGATETTSPAVLMPPVHAVERAAQVGLPVPCADIRIMDAEGREVPAGDTGEIWISGPMVVKGYWRNPEATKKEFVGPYWCSGDVGSVDDQGFIRIIDRIKDVINRGGYKIFASEVENHLLALKKVLDVAVVAKSCEVLGERVHAFVVAAPDVDAEMLTDHCDGAIADYKRPEEYHFVEELPRNANGKVLKRDLRDQLEKG